MVDILTFYILLSAFNHCWGFLAHRRLNGQNIVGGADDMWEGRLGEENDALSMAVKRAEQTELAI